MTTYSAFGTLLGSGSTAGSAIVAAISEIEPGEMSLEVVDVSTHNTAGKQVKPARTVDGGTVKMTVFWDPAEATHSPTAGSGLAYLLQQKTRNQWHIDFPTSPAKLMYFYGYVTKFAIKAPIDEMLTAEVEISVDGAVTFA